MRRMNRKLFITAIVLLILVVVTRLFFWGEIRAWRYRNYTEVPIVEASDWFDYPVGAPNARGYYKAQEFGNSFHLGEDWNGMGGGDSDYGDSVYAIANGSVVSTEEVGAGWGNIVRIIHPVKDGKSVEAIYAHLAKMYVHKGDTITRGQKIGTIGDAGGCYQAHLHFEIRTEVGLPLGGGYSRNNKGFCDPTIFISSHRKKPCRNSSPSE
jgi:murein DD-endopeptidase MepM/ murein hydrolase activator NlpD